ncbi:MAG TPA: GMC family oxidoreductase, partial [Nitrososphaerales archaeon]|nr:GMC family oxidoreductase [Nitrososphaerales archaeon]
TQSTFRAYVDEVWSDLGVNVSESQLNQNNRALFDGCTRLGFEEGRDFHMIERNAKGCAERCDFCTYGCRYACKQSTSLTYLPRAQRRGARLIFNTRVERIVVADGMARGAECTHDAGGKASRVLIDSRAVVVAAGGIETPALLLRSGVKDKNIGNYLRLDPTVAMVGVFENQVDPWKGPPQTVAVWKFIDLDGTYHGFWVEAAPAHPGLFALAVPWQDGRRHKEFMARYYSRSAASIILLRERSHGRVAIDKRGYPRVDYSLGSEDKSMLVRGMQETARILAAAGAQSIWTTHNDPVSVGDDGRPILESSLDEFANAVKARGVEPNRLALFSAHLMGSCRMSSDPAQGPTSPSGELHTVKNLYIGDACVFPTTPAVNPMITIMAMARRTAESIKTALGGGATNQNAR